MNNLRNPFLFLKVILVIGWIQRKMILKTHLYKLFVEDFCVCFCTKNLYVHMCNIYNELNITLYTH